MNTVGECFGMANPKHVKLARKGPKYVNEWRKKHPDEVLDLSEADLRFLNLSTANLSNCNLEKVNLSSSSDFSKSGSINL